MHPLLQLSQRPAHCPYSHQISHRTQSSCRRRLTAAPEAVAFTPARAAHAPDIHRETDHAAQLLEDLLGDVLPAHHHVTAEQARSVAVGLALLADTSYGAVRTHVQALLMLLQPSEVLDVVCRQPRLLVSPLDAWVTFLTSYGIPAEQLPRLLMACPELFAGSIHETGEVIMMFKRLGWRDEDILCRILHYYPHLLANTVAADMQPVLDFLAQQGCSQKDIRLLVWEFPRIFSHDYRRHVRKFQRLGVYGLHMP